VTFGPQRWAPLLAVLILAGGYLAVFRPSEAAIAERYDQLEDARATIARDAVFERELPALERERAQREDAVNRRHLGEPPDALVDRVLRTLAAIALHDRVTLQRVAGGAPARADLPGEPAPATFLLDDLSLDVTLRGAYRDVIHAVRDLDSADFAARIAVADLRPALRKPHTVPRLDVSFHVTLLREADAATTHAAHS
jgi:hypothetical protein